MASWSRQSSPTRRERRRTRPATGRSPTLIGTHASRRSTVCAGWSSTARSAPSRRATAAASGATGSVATSSRRASGGSRPAAERLAGNGPRRRADRRPVLRDDGRPARVEAPPAPTSGSSCSTSRPAGVDLRGCHGRSAASGWSCSPRRSTCRWSCRPLVEPSASARRGHGRRPARGDRPQGPDVDLPRRVARGLDEGQGPSWYEREAWRFDRR